MKLTAYHRPTTLSDAQRILRELGPAGLPLAGATSHVFMKGDEEKSAVDLAAIGLDQIAVTSDGFLVGANTRIADLQAYHAPGWVLDSVALHFVSQPIRNMTTIGGNIVRVFPWNDFPVALLALGAEMVISGDQVATHHADTYFKGQPARLFQPGDLLTEIKIPAIGANCGFGYHKETVVNMDFSLLTVAAWMRLDKKTVADIRIAAGAGIPLPSRLSNLEVALQGKLLTADLIQMSVASSVEAIRWKGSDGFSDVYIKQLACAHIADAILAAWQMAKGGAK
jgi:aerobic carbon-monoxide dehydrogenase medium subunit